MYTYRSRSRPSTVDTYVVSTSIMPTNTCNISFDINIHDIVLYMCA